MKEPYRTLYSSADMALLLLFKELSFNISFFYRLKVQLAINP